MKTLILITVTAGFISLVPYAGNGAEVKAIYDNQCAKCHGSNGKGDTKFGKKLGVKDYTDAKVQAAMTDDKAFKAIKEGLKDGEKILMKPAEKVTDADIQALVAHMRSFGKK
jgi:mono/diheme cytochrome c family protein